MLALICASLTFCIVFWSVCELGQPWIHWGFTEADLDGVKAGIDANTAAVQAIPTT